MPNIALSEARVKALKSRKSTYDIRDGKLRGFGVRLLGSIVRPVIVVDWADSALEHKQLILKTEVPVKGRAISIYGEVHPMRRYNSPKTHERLLQ